MEPSRIPSGVRRPVIGIMTGSLHTDYSRNMAEAANRAVVPWADVYLFQGYDAGRFMDKNTIVDESFDRHYYSQFQYAGYLSPDLLVISFGTISAISEPLPVETFLAALPRVPVILLETEYEAPGVRFVSTDNYAGMRECILHLIEAHGCRKICFVSGPKDVCDAALRLRAYRETMEEKGLPAGENQIVYGDFSDNVDDLVEELIARNPGLDALVCANDEMAESAYRALRRAGLEPGRDVAVTGFDDSSSAAFMDPPLTTVRQDCEAQGRKASELALRMLRGEEVRSVYLPARLQVRCSCGCQGVEQGNHNAFLMSERVSKKRMVHENLISALLLRNLLQEDVTVHSFFYSLGKVLSTIGARSSRIALLKEPMDVHGKGRLFLPEELRVHLVQEGEELTSFSRELAPLVTMGGFSPLLTIPSGGRYATAVFPLFYGNMHYGVLLVQTERNDILFDFMLSLEIGTGLRYLYLALAQQVSQAALEAQNDVLNYSANHDALTGLLNRAGITRAIAAYLQGARREERYVVVMADLDHLKQINDTFGHSAGDLAIRTAAELLQGALPVGSPLGRTGGDEFSAVFAVSERYDAACFQTRLAELTRIWNLEHSIPFLVRVSAGVHTFSFSDTNDLAQVIKFADADLYRAKKSRPDSVILA